MKARTLTLEINCENEECCAGVEFICDIQEGGIEGSDADGNRGVWVPAQLIAPDEVICGNCGKDNTAQAAQFVEDYDLDSETWPDREPDEPSDFEREELR